MDLNLKQFIRTIPNWPRPGIIFRDITPIFSNGRLFQKVLGTLYDAVDDEPWPLVAGIEARGFILGAPLAATAGAAFIPIRKKGKLPAEKVAISYGLEYGNDALEIHKDAFLFGSSVYIVDDIIATGGTALAAIDLVQRVGGKVVGVGTVIDLPHLGGSRKVKELGIPCTSIVQYEE